jgi:hypothetical protein
MDELRQQLREEQEAHEHTKFILSRKAMSQEDRAELLKALLPPPTPTLA